MNSKELNTCYYSKGGKHNTCTHPHYCIFNPNRWRLETTITRLEKELEQRITDLKFIKNEGTSNCADYEFTKARITLLNTDLEKLRKNKENIIKEEVKAYGHI